MSKRKAQKPAKLSDKESAAFSWNLATKSADDSRPEPGIQDSDLPTPARLNKKRSKKRHVFESQAQEFLYSLLTQAYVTLPLSISSNNLTRNGTTWSCHLGTVSFKIAPLSGTCVSRLRLDYPIPESNLLQEGKTVDSLLHLYSYFDEDKHYLYLEIKSDKSLPRERCYSAELSEFDVTLVASLSTLCKTRRAGDVILKSYDETSGDVVADVFLLEGCVQPGLSNSDGFKPRTFNKSLQVIINHFCGIPLPVTDSADGGEEAHVDILYEYVYRHHRQHCSTYCPDTDVQHSSLKPKLRPYQIDAIRWMLHMEKQHETTDCVHPLWNLVTATDGQQFYYNQQLGAIQLKMPRTLPRMAGGILTDEMGLGKTVEVLGCVLMNPRTDLDEQRHTVEAEPSLYSSDDDYVSDTDGDSVVIGDDSGVIDETGASRAVYNGRESNEAEDGTSDSTVDFSRSDPITRSSPNSALDVAKSYAKTRTRTSHHTSLTVRSSLESQPLSCVCGGKTPRRRWSQLIQCSQCQSVQHARCVNYTIDHRHTSPYFCPHCCVVQALLPSATTLIISPSSISRQWIDEIHRHVKDREVRVLEYRGVKSMGFVQPTTLASYDIVITTYDTLRSEINFVGLPHCGRDEGRRFRQAKRYMTTPSPLTAVEWWRVCIDEAQMIEVPTAKATSMALTLSAVNRWCVTGTPIQRGMEDLYGLIVFLGIDPYHVPHWWKMLVSEPYKRGDRDRLFRMATSCLWRTSKRDVFDQIGIPDQHEQLHHLNFSPVERHFYGRKFESCSDQARDLLNPRPGPEPMSEMCRKQKLVRHLTKLRQACCHPQAVRGEFIPLRKQTMTMEELLATLIDKTRLECEEAHRVIISTLNGLAGLHLIDNQVPEAVEKYRESLNSIRSHKVELRTDPLQTFHTLHNLNDLLITYHDDLSISRTLQDDTFTDEASKIAQEYSKKFRSSVTAAELQLEPIQKKLTELRSTYRGYWWLDTIEHITDMGQEEELVTKIKSKLTDNTSTTEEEVHGIIHKFHNSHSLQYIVTVKYEQLHENRQKVCGAVSELNHEPSHADIERAVACHLRVDKTSQPTKTLCPFCEAKKMLAEYEARLFSAKSTSAGWVNTAEDSTKPLVTWAESDLEKTLKIISTMGQAVSAGGDLRQEGRNEKEKFTQMKKEFKTLSALWRSLRDSVSGLDELEMAKTRIRLRIEGEEKPEQPVSHIIEMYQVEENRIRFLSDRIVAENDLKRKLGQLMYLKNLSKAQSDTDQNTNPELCPICDKELGTEWAVLLCGHSFCSACISFLADSVIRSTIRCPICRDVLNVSNISYVTTNPPQDEPENGLNIRGSHSTKVYAVVKELKMIQAADPTAKSLVFSTWPDVLQVIEGALGANHMPCRCLSKKYYFQKYLDTFKTDPSVNVLLLPIHTGSKGLNIIEATHVLFVEPLINPAAELQAVGRVHRIGQTRPTTVHKFVIQGTIEERLYQLMKKANVRDFIDPQAEEEVLSIDDLWKLFQVEDIS